MTTDFNKLRVEKQITIEDDVRMWLGFQVQRQKYLI